MFGFLRKKLTQTMVKQFYQKAQQGDAYSQWQMGIQYEQGQAGYPQDYVEAAKWYRKAAEQDHHGAQLYLGVILAQGQGVQQNAIEGLKWILLAKRGNAMDRMAASDTQQRLEALMDAQKVNEARVMAAQFAAKREDRCEEKPKSTRDMMKTDHEYNKNGFCKACGWHRQYLERTGRPCAGSSQEAQKKEPELPKIEVFSKTAHKDHSDNAAFLNIAKAVILLTLIFFALVFLGGALFDKKHTGKPVEYTIIYTTINGQRYEKEATASDYSSEFVTFADGTRVSWSTVKTIKQTVYSDDLSNAAEIVNKAISGASK